jgi:small multidrug resistance pump
MNANFIQVTNSWISLSIAIIFGVFGTIALKKSHGFINTRYISYIIINYAISFIAMTYALKHMELSVVYAVWSGVGTVLVTLFSIYHFHEPISIKRIIYLLLIVIGVFGIHFNAIN